MGDKKILQAILDGQTSIKKDIKEVRDEVKNNGGRIDKLGTQLAELENDSPTIKEFDGLKKRVGKVEKQVASN